MCTIIFNTDELKIADAPMTVYKQFFKAAAGNVRSPIMNFEYELNKLYKTKITYTDSYDYFDKTEYIMVKNFALEQPLKQLIGIREGFHSALTPYRAQKARFRGEPLIYKCTIPEGAYYHIGIDPNLIVSDQIIVKELELY